MLKKFLNGLIFGAGFGIAFVTICILGFSFITPQIFVGKSIFQLTNESEKGFSLCLKLG